MDIKLAAGRLGRSRVALEAPSTMRIRRTSRSHRATTRAGSLRTRLSTDKVKGIAWLLIIPR